MKIVWIVAGAGCLGIAACTPGESGEGEAGWWERTRDGFPYVLDWDDERPREKPGPRYDDPRALPTGAIENQPSANPPRPAIDLSTKVDAELRAELITAYEAKLGNPEYLVWKSRAGLPTGFQSWGEEAKIKALRSEIARRMRTPRGLQPIRVPIVSTSLPILDGRLDEAEWMRGTRVALDRANPATHLYLVSDGESLYLGCDVPGDTTVPGYDQFRFHFHVDLAEAIRNERIHVSGGKREQELGGIRQTTIRWDGAPPTSDAERWKKFPVSDWRIYRRARGAADVHGHRQYEAVIDLSEAGLHTGVPFPAFVEVETDPSLKPDGSFSNRNYLGFLGSQAAPVWFVIEG